jgi:hypothetical protein
VRSGAGVVQSRSADEACRHFARSRRPPAVADVQKLESPSADHDRMFVGADRALARAAPTFGRCCSLGGFGHRSCAFGEPAIAGRRESVCRLRHATEAGVESFERIVAMSGTRDAAILDSPSPFDVCASPFGRTGVRHPLSARRFFIVMRRSGVARHRTDAVHKKDLMFRHGRTVTASVASHRGADCRHRLTVCPFRRAVRAVTGPTSALSRRFSTSVD